MQELGGPRHAEVLALVVASLAAAPLGSLR